MTLDAPTHAGGLVYRHERGGVQYLLVRPKDGTDAWVLPKGHIEPGEDPETAALREVREETGVVARPLARLEPNVRYRAHGEDVNVVLFVMEYLHGAAPAEERRTAWFSFSDALARLTHADNRRALALAEAKRTAPGAPHTSG